MAGVYSDFLGGARGPLHVDASFSELVDLPAQMTPCRSTHFGFDADLGWPRSSSIREARWRRGRAHAAVFTMLHCLVNSRLSDNTYRRRAPAAGLKRVQVATLSCEAAPRCPRNRSSKAQATRLDRNQRDLSIPTSSIITAGQLLLEKTVKNNKEISATHFADS